MVSENTDQRSRVTRSLLRARAVQLGMPPDAPVLPELEIGVHYEACEELGGDFYDFIQVSPTELGIVLADVSGHGLNASVTRIDEAMPCLSVGDIDAAREPAACAHELAEKEGYSRDCYERMGAELLDVQATPEEAVRLRCPGCGQRYQGSEARIKSLTKCLKCGMKPLKVQDGE